MIKHEFVICAYKESKYLEDCIISLKKQKKMVAVLEKIDAKIRTNNKINDYLSYQSSMAA